MISKNRHRPPSLSAERRIHGIKAWAIALAALLLACLLIALGVADGAFTDVWQRASMVCYECIGIG